MKYLILLFIFLPGWLAAQSNDGYYMNWNRDHTGRTIKPMIPISVEEAKIVNCYYVEFDEDHNFKSVKYFNSGKPSVYANYGAHELVRIYTDAGYEDVFKGIDGKEVLNASGIKKQQYKLDDEGYWIEVRNLDATDNLVEDNGVAISKVKRDYQNRILTELQINLANDTIPDVNDFKVVHFTYDNNGYMTARQNRDANGKPINGKQGYATVVFQYDHNGMFYGEEFLNADNELTIHPNIGYAKIDLRDFNKFGKSSRQYYSDENGYPCAHSCMGKFTYNANMSRKELKFYNRIGDEAEDHKGRAKIMYEYESDGKFRGRKYYNLKGELE